MLTIAAETRAMERYLDGMVRDQLPFAVSLGVNNLARAFQEAEKQGIEERFIVRRRWVLTHVRFDRVDRSTKQQPQATVRLEDPSSVFAGGSLLAKFEFGGVKLATEEGKSFPGIGKQLAIPIDAPTGASGVVPLAYSPTSLGLAQFRIGAKGSFHGTPALRGKRRTFVIMPGTSTSFPSGGIFQRTGPGPRDLKLLFVLKPRVPIPARLEFYETAQRIADEQWEQHFNEALERALKTA